MIETAQDPESTAKSQTQTSQAAQSFETAAPKGFSPAGTHEQAESRSRVAPRNPGWMDSRSRESADLRPTDWSDDGWDPATPSVVSTDETGENLSVVVGDDAVDLELIDALKGMYFFG